MRRKTQKKIEKFVDKLIQNSTSNERGNKTREQLVDEVKVLWYKDGEYGQKFIDSVVAGKFDGIKYRVRRDA